MRDAKGTTGDTISKRFSTVNINRSGLLAGSYGVTLAFSSFHTRRRPEAKPHLVAVKKADAKG
jgi:hypothetical protein